MSSEGDQATTTTDGSNSKNGGRIDKVIERFDTIGSPIDYIKRFFYQILGIYFPAIMIILYFLLFWKEQPHVFSLTYNATSSNISHIVSPEENLKSLFLFINKSAPNQILELLLFTVGVAALGEAINSATSKVAKISPIKKRHVKGSYLDIKGKKIAVIAPFGRGRFPYSDPTKIADWPIWMNITQFPVTFAHFDRFYVSVLEQDKKTLAGKIGWISFYRNMTAVFVMILILQSYLIYHFSIIHGKKLFENYLYEYYVLAIAVASIVLFYLGYHAQVKAHRTTLWDAYRRNELRKNLEIRYGELSLALGVKNEFKKKAIEYMVDRWFLGVEQSMQSSSSFLLIIVEELYRRFKEPEGVGKENHVSSNRCFTESIFEKAKEPIKAYVQVMDHKHDCSSKKLEKVESKVKELLIDSYKEWNVGGYTQVLSNALKALEIFQLGLTVSAWQTMRGAYTLENSLRTDAAFREVEDNIIKWGWTYQKENSKNKQKNIEDEMTDSWSHVGSFEIKQDFDQAANIISKSNNVYRDNFDKIMNLLKELRTMRRGILHDVRQFNLTIDDKSTNLRIELDCKTSEVEIDGKTFRLDNDDLNKHKKLYVDFNGIVSNISIDDEAIIIYDKLNEIYRLFGAHQFGEAGGKAEELLERIRVTNVLLNNRKNKIKRTELRKDESTKAEPVRDEKN